MKTLSKAFSGNVRISQDDERTVTVTASTAVVDREGEVLVPGGCYSKNWEKNPVILFVHEGTSLPVGKGLAVERTDEGVRIKYQFFSRPPTHPEAQEWVPDTLWWMVQNDGLKAHSVGFISKEHRAATNHDLKKYGDDCRYVHSKWELLELSIVPLPCNPEALAEAVSKGLVTKAAADRLASPAEIPADDEKPAEETATEVLEKTLDVLEAISDGLDQPADEPKVKEITREITPAKRVAAVVEVAQPAVERVKHVHRFIEPPAAEVATKTVKTVVRTLSKMRGRIYADD